MTPEKILMVRSPHLPHWGLWRNPRYTPISGPSESIMLQFSKFWRSSFWIYSTASHWTPEEFQMRAHLTDQPRVPWATPKVPLWSGEAKNWIYEPQLKVKICDIWPSSESKIISTACHWFLRRFRHGIKSYLHQKYLVHESKVALIFLRFDNGIAQ